MDELPISEAARRELDQELADAAESAEPAAAPTCCVLGMPA